MIKAAKQHPITVLDLNGFTSLTRLTKAKSIKFVELRVAVVCKPAAIMLRSDAQATTVTGCNQSVNDRESNQSAIIIVPLTSLIVVHIKSQNCMHMMHMVYDSPMQDQPAVGSASSCCHKCRTGCRGTCQCRGHVCLYASLRLLQACISLCSMICDEADTAVSHDKNNAVGNA